MQEEQLGYRRTAARFNIRHKQVQDWEHIYLTEGGGLFGRTRWPREQRPRAEDEYLKNLQTLVLEDERRQCKKRG